MTSADPDHLTVATEAARYASGSAMSSKLREADLDRAQGRLADARRHVSTASAVQDFLGRHPGLSLSALIEAAEAERAGAASEVEEALGAITVAEQAATEAREHVRDLEGAVRVLKAKIAEDEA